MIMKAIIVCESLWGNTAAIAMAIAEGLGPDACAFSTAEATLEIITGADFISVGSPVHSLGMPTEQSREWARSGTLGSNGAPPDRSHPMMRIWLDTLPESKGMCAAFDPRVKAWYGRGAASRILKKLEILGYQPLSKACGFYAAAIPSCPPPMARCARVKKNAPDSGEQNWHGQ
jgi:hypothetical protein